jgi:branched-chain amino acid aminotransferase
LTDRENFLMNKKSECIGDKMLVNDRLKPCRPSEPMVLREGVSIYEIFRVIQRVPVFLEDHLSRLYHSLELEGHSLGEQPGDIADQVRRLVEANPLDTGKVKLIVTYSPINDSRDYDLLMYFVPFEPPKPEQYRAGVDVVLCQAVRSDPNAKVLNTQARRLADQRIEQLGVYEALLVDARGYITEGSRSNLFFISGDQLVTPPDDAVLQGIARKNILRICREEGIPIQVRRVHQQELPSFNSAFLSGTTPQVLPIRTIGDRAYSVENKTMRFLMEAYQGTVQEYIRRTS